MGPSNAGPPCWMWLTTPAGYRSRSQKLTSLSSLMVTRLPHLMLRGCEDADSPGAAFRVLAGGRARGPGSEAHAAAQLCVTQRLPHHAIKDKTREPMAYVFRKHKCFPASRSQEFLQTITDTPSLLVWTGDKLLLAIQTFCEQKGEEQPLRPS